MKFDEWLKTQELSKNSMDQYRSNFNVLTKKAGLSLLKDTQEKIITSLKKLGHKPSTQRTILATAVAFMTAHDRPVEKIAQYRRQVQRELFEAKAEANKSLTDELPTSKALLSHELVKHDNGDWRGYIVCNLLRLLHCRNLDLQLCLVRDRKRANHCTSNFNYLVLDDARKQLLVLRRNYKTSGTYGTKRRVLAGKKLYQAANQLLGDKDHEWLLVNKKGAKVKDNDLSRVVSRHTFQNLSEGAYNKVLVSEIKSVKDFGKLKKISDERGTSIAVLLDNYHTDSTGHYFST